MSARLSLEDLLHGYTLYGAIQLRLTEQIGSIEVGKSANLVVLDADLFDVPDDKIHDVEPVAVLFEGRVVHGSLTN
jgi:predicted amidohydrolase YtcJ